MKLRDGWGVRRRWHLVRRTLTPKQRLENYYILDALNYLSEEVHLCGLFPTMQAHSGSGQCGVNCRDRGWRQGGDWGVKQGVQTSADVQEWMVCEHARTTDSMGFRCKHPVCYLIYPAECPLRIKSLWPISWWEKGYTEGYSHLPTDRVRGRAKAQTNRPARNADPRETKGKQESQTVSKKEEALTVFAKLPWDTRKSKVTHSNTGQHPKQKTAGQESKEQRCFCRAPGITLGCPLLPHRAALLMMHQGLTPQRPPPQTSWSALGCYWPARSKICPAGSWVLPTNLNLPCVPVLYPPNS